ncbi:MAG: proline--tRNA ligase [Actinomycetota bacterium]|nr:proline--tRNA ligase [Actinomycetota bacterium]
MSRHPLQRQSIDFPAWYGEVVRRAGLAESSLVRGAMVIKPYGYAIWEAIQRALDERIRATGHENVYFPLFIPSAVLDRERELVEGFAPEVAVVTHARGKKLEEPLVVRPTSEAVIWATYARWIQSYRDLPLLYNQWANVVRWELRPRLFLRTTEFLWQEGHTAHETEDEAIAEALRILHDVYADTAEQVLAIPVLRGRKSASERFPGAVETFAIEALMRDGKALQAGTSHYLGQSFARAYNVRFTDRGGHERYAYATSWGASTRLVGGLIMAHGDDSGLRLPPAVAPHQIVIVPISGGDGGWVRVREASEALATMLRAAGLRVRLDDREDIRPGFKFNEWELKGVPLRVELGERELDARQATLVRRDTGARETASADRVAGRAGELLAEIQQRLLDEARAFRAEHTLESPKSYEVLREFLAAAAGLAIAPWCGSPSCEDRVKRETRATIRCLPLERVSIKAECIVCEAPAVEHASWSQAY